MQYRQNGLVIERKTGDGFLPVRVARSTKEARQLLLAVTINPAYGKNWPVIAAKSSAADIPAPPMVLPATYQEAWDKIYSRVLADTNDENMAYQAALGVIRRLNMGMPVKGRRRREGLFSGDHVRMRREDDRIFCEGWAIMFGDPDILDTWYTFFDHDTDFFEDFYKAAPLWYEHGFDDAYGHAAIGERYELRRYKFGLYATHELYQEHPLYSRTLAELERGELAHSSDSIGHYVDMGFDGAKLGVWPLAGISLVKRPAEPGLGLVTFTTAS